MPWPHLRKKQQDQRHFFGRYRKIVFLTDGVIIVCALILFFFLFQDNLKSRVGQMELRLREQSQALSYIIRLRSDAVKAMQNQAQDLLKDYNNHPHNAYVPPLSQDPSGFFYLDAHSDEKGILIDQKNPKTQSTDNRQEMAMAYSLSPFFRSTKQNMQTAVLAFYISKNGFRFDYPWREPENIIGKGRDFYKKEIYLKSLPQHNPDRSVFWSDLFQSPKGAALVSCAAPVYGVRNEFRGLIGMDFTLEAVSDFVAGIQNESGRLLVMNDQNTILAADRMSLEDGIILKADKILPPDLTMGVLAKMPRKQIVRHGDYWIFQTNLRYAPWRIVYFTPARELFLHSLMDVGPGVLVLVLFSFLIVIASNALISREFITPAMNLVTFITNNGALGPSDFNAIKAPWKQWFDDVNRVFLENKELIKKREDTIKTLDQQVLDRTKDLSLKNTELIDALGRLKQAQDHLILQEKLAGLGALTAGIAHEIKNPLNFVINFAELSLEFMDDIETIINESDLTIPHDQIQKIKALIQDSRDTTLRITHHGKRADEILRSMLDHAGAGVNVQTQTNINDLLIENATLALSGFQGYNVLPKTQKKLDLTLPDLFIFRQNMGRVFLNIIGNACYFLEQKRLTHGDDFNGILTLKTAQTPDSVIITIGDNGPGIPPDLQKNIFMPFMTTKPSGVGTGLGLSLSYEIITQQHGGTLSVSSVPGQSTEMTIVLPKTILDRGVAI